MRTKATPNPLPVRDFARHRQTLTSLSWKSAVMGVRPAGSASRSSHVVGRVLPLGHATYLHGRPLGRPLPPQSGRGRGTSVTGTVKSRALRATKVRRLRAPSRRCPAERCAPRAPHGSDTSDTAPLHHSVALHQAGRPSAQSARGLRPEEEETAAPSPAWPVVDHDDQNALERLVRLRL